VLQGLTLRPLLRWLDLRDDRPVEREIVLAPQSLLQGALAVIDGRSSKAAKALRLEMEALWSPDGSPRAGGSGLDPVEYRELHQNITRGARQELVQLRERGEIGDDAFHAVELKIDRAEIYIDTPRSGEAASEG
jgi:hypothetical protein